MATFHSGSRHTVSYVEETTFNTTPASPEMLQVPIASVNISPTKDVFNDPSIRSDRSIRFQRHGNIRVNGDVEVAYQHGTYDDFLAAALHGDWASNVLKQGVTRHSFTIERGFTDLASPMYQRFTGCVVNQLQLSVPVNDVVKATFNVMGAGQASASAPLDATPTVVAGKAPMTHLSGTFLEAGTAIGNITALTLTIANGYGENFVLGNNTPANLTYGYATVSGQLTVYFDSATLYNKFINETGSTLSFAINDGAGNVHTWVLPNVKYNGMTLPVTNDQAIQATVPFVALFDNATSTAVQVTRT